MNRPQPAPDSAYVLHQRYEDTAMVIFQQQSKRRKEGKGGSGLHALPYHPTQQDPHPHPQGLTTPAPLSSHLPPPSSSSSPSVRTRLPSPNSLPASNDGPASGAAAEFGEGVGGGRGDREGGGGGVMAMRHQSDIILSHPLSQVEVGVGGGESPLQSSTHSDLTNPSTDLATDSATHTDDDDRDDDNEEEEDDNTMVLSHLPHCQSGTDAGQDTGKLTDNASCSAPLNARAETDPTHSASQQGVRISPLKDAQQPFPQETVQHLEHSVPQETVQHPEHSVPQETVQHPEHSVPQERVEHASADEVTHPVSAVTVNCPDATQNDVKHPTSQHGAGTDSDVTGVPDASADSEVKQDLPGVFTGVPEASADSEEPKDCPDVFTEDEYSGRESGGSLRQATGTGRVSGVQFAHYGSAGVVARRKVAMSKADQTRTQSRVCVVM
ncbi:hypothetical protein ACOMHN_027729 [Nucella lapillus]